MDKLILNNIEVENNRIDYIYTFEGKWNSLLKKEEKFFVEYDFDVDSIPKSILVIPFLCNILPICWIFDLQIFVDDKDKEFYVAIENIKDGYQKMFHNINMKGKIIANNIVENKYEAKNVGALFSGGVDAFNTLFNHIDEKPTLLTIWGADIPIDDVNSWEKVKKYNIETAKQFDLDYSFVRSNFRTFLEYSILSNYVRKFVNDEWWHGFQHGIGMLGQMAPLAYKKGFRTLYIASSFTKEFKGKYTCSSDPTIDNYFKFASCNTIHDGYEFNRQDKIHNICNYLENNKDKSINIRVCWQSKNGDNCCKCEKCYRTILGIIAEKKSPKDFGFNFTDKDRKRMANKIISYAKYNPSRYLYIQKRFKENYPINETPKDLIKFRKLEIKMEKPNYMIFFEKNKPIEKIKIEIKRIIKMITNKK